MRTPWAQRLLRAGDAIERGVFGSSIGNGPALRPGDTTLGILEKIYRAALAVNPLSAYAHSDLGRIALRSGRISEALAGYARARELAPFDAYLSLEHARALDAAGRDEDAVVILKAAAAQYPEFAEPYGMIGFLLLKRRHHAEAENWLKRSLELDWRGNTGAAFAAASNLAALYHGSGRETEAALAAQRANSFLAPGR
jgi:tetratricopeptide (TPR) repeat protein